MQFEYRLELADVGSGKKLRGFSLIVTANDWAELQIITDAKMQHLVAAMSKQIRLWQERDSPICPEAGVVCSVCTKTCALEGE